MVLVSSWGFLCPIDWGQMLSREWRYIWSSADRRCSNYTWVTNNFIAYWSPTYIRYLTVVHVHKGIWIGCGNSGKRHIMSDLCCCIDAPTQYQHFSWVSDMITYDYALVTPQSHKDNKTSLEQRSMHPNRGDYSPHSTWYWDVTHFRKYPNSIIKI